MAQNLGLHRESVTTSNDPEEMAKIEHRRRVWATCVIVDRWQVPPFNLSLAAAIHPDGHADASFSC